MLQKSYDNTPTLFLIPTPIGNMEDITFRAVTTLKNVDFLLCEDTRVTGQLLKKLDIRKKMISCHDHNEDNVKRMVIDNLKEGKNIGLVTDRGTPIISDPGYKIVEEVANNGYNVVGLPGPTALIPALIMSGVNPSPFLFYGFLNSKSSKRKKELENLKRNSYTTIFYEAPHRIKETLNDIYSVFGNRRIALCREISKMYEDVYRGTLKDLLIDLAELKGEIVLVVEGNLEVENYEEMTVIEHIKLYLEDGMTEKEAIKKVSVEREIPKSLVYKEYHLNGGK